MPAREGDWSSPSNAVLSYTYVLLTALLGLAVTAQAEGYLYDPAGVADDFFGNSMTELGDLNGDGLPDIAREIQQELKSAYSVF